MPEPMNPATDDATPPVAGHDLDQKAVDAAVEAANEATRAGWDDHDQLLAGIRAYVAARPTPAPQADGDARALAYIREAGHLTGCAFTYVTAPDLDEPCDCGHEAAVAALRSSRPEPRGVGFDTYSEFKDYVLEYFLPKLAEVKERAEANGWMITHWDIQSLAVDEALEAFRADLAAAPLSPTTTGEPHA